MRQRSQALRSIIGLRRDNGEEITVPQAGNLYYLTYINFQLFKVAASVQNTVLTNLSVADGVQDQWSSWSSCSVSCGEGWQSRTRNCMTSGNSMMCIGPLRENRPCNNSVVCPGIHTHTYTYPHACTNTSALIISTFVPNIICSYLVLRALFLL